jgi:hypothetical protein
MRPAPAVARVAKPPPFDDRAFNQRIAKVGKVQKLVSEVEAERRASMPSIPFRLRDR